MLKCNVSIFLSRNIRYICRQKNIKYDDYYVKVYFFDTFSKEIRYICRFNFTYYKFSTMSIDLLKEIFLSPFGSFASVFSLFAVAFWLVHYITKKGVEIRTSQKNIESSVENIQNRIDARVDKIEGHIDGIRKDIAYLRGVTDLIQSSPNQSVAKRKSTVSLSDLGSEISNKMNVGEMIARNWDKIFADLEANIRSGNAYDIQQYCLDTSIIELSKFIDEADLNKVKTYAFNEGRPLAFYAPIFAILIRDKYFEIKGINTSFIDYYEPTLRNNLQ